MNLNQVTLPSLDIERSIRFYQKLGLNLIVKALPHYARFECPEGQSTFSVHLVKELPSDGGSYIYFEIENLDKEVKRLISMGLKFSEEPSDKSWLWREAKIKDPDGNQLILYYAGKNRKNPPWRLEESK